MSVYYLRSTALGGRVIAEVDESGRKRKGEVYLGGERLAELETADGPGRESITFKHADPSRGSYAESYLGGAAARRELDPLGQEVGTSDPYARYGGSYGQMAGSDPLYGEGGNPFDAGHGCALDGIAVPCSFAMERLNNGMAVFDTITTVTIRRNGGATESYSRRAGLPAGYGARFTGFAAGMAAAAFHLYREDGFGAAVFNAVLWGRLAGGAGTDARAGTASSFFAPQKPVQPPPDVAGIRSELERMLKDPKCADFIKDLLGRVSARFPNTLVSGGNILDVYDEVNSPRQRGMLRAGAPGSYSSSYGGNYALGSIAGGDARIQIGTHTPGPPTAALDAPIALHETIHHSGRNVYSDQVLAEAVRDITGRPITRWDGAPLTGDPSRDVGIYSTYWGTELRNRCK